MKTGRLGNAGHNSPGYNRTEPPQNTPFHRHIHPTKNSLLQLFVHLLRFGRRISIFTEGSSSFRVVPSTPKLPTTRPLLHPTFYPYYAPHRSSNTVSSLPVPQWYGTPNPPGSSEISDRYTQGIRYGELGEPKNARELTTAVSLRRETQDGANKGK